MSLGFQELWFRLGTSQAPALPWPDAAQAYLVLGWATVMACGVGLLLRRHPLAVRAGAMAGMALWALWPGPVSPVYWLGLAFQAPSLVTVAGCAWVLWRTLHPASASPWLQRNQRAALAWGAAGLLALGWVLLLDTFAVWPVALYALGFSPALVGVLGLCASLPWCLGGRSLQPLTFTLYGLLLLQVLTRWPDGNLWNAVLDPGLWLGLHGWVLVRLVRRSQQT